MEGDLLVRKPLAASLISVHRGMMWTILGLFQHRFLAMQLSLEVFSSVKNLLKVPVVSNEVTNCTTEESTFQTRVYSFDVELPFLGALPIVLIVVLTSIFECFTVS